ncbi:MAG: fumarylacetoacetate hydrolase [Alphaproteobacteria bacterium]|nr:MAG: fumarylacetoacetate hydrolase [Alphaproteobacteria bacterium]
MSHAILPTDADRALLVGRAWLPQRDGQPAGPAMVAVAGDTLVDITPSLPTLAHLLMAVDPAASLRAAVAAAAPGLPLAPILANALAEERDRSLPVLLAPADLQPIKASGVTFVASLLERVIEEQARGDLARAASIRAEVTAVIGDDLAKVRPGSAQAAELKALLIAKGAWSQYLEVGIGPDAEIFTKCPPMAAVGLGAEVGVLATSHWNNPEPEVVLVIAPTGQVVGATLGNDVNLRDVEGRSALLLGKAKDNTASCALGPFIRLFDDRFSIADLRQAELTMTVAGPDGFTLHGASSMARISRDPLDLAAQCLGPSHQYPDGVLLFLGTMFAPTQDRGEVGKGFTHQIGDVVSIATPSLGTLVNRVTTCDQAEPWTFGLRALFQHLAARGIAV